MTAVEVRNRFFGDPIIVQFGQNDRSYKTRDWIDQEIGHIAGVKIEFVELDDPFFLSVKLFHQGDVITGQRLRYFVSYAQKLGAL